jgi:hypothetical protein
MFPDCHQKRVRDNGDGNTIKEFLFRKQMGHHFPNVELKPHESQVKENVQPLYLPVFMVTGIQERPVVLLKPLLIALCGSSLPLPAGRQEGLILVKMTNASFFVL